MNLKQLKYHKLPPQKKSGKKPEPNLNKRKLPSAPTELLLLQQQTEWFEVFKVLFVFKVADPTSALTQACLGGKVGTEFAHHLSVTLPGQFLSY